MNNYPHDTEAEKAIIGCCLQDPNLLDEVNLEWFYDLRFREFVEIIRDMRSAGSPVDDRTALHKISGVKTQFEIRPIDFMEASPSALNFPYWKAILEEKRVLRALCELSHETFQKAQAADCNPQEALEQFEIAAMKIRGTDAADVADIKALVRECMDDLDEAAKNKGKLNGLPTGFCDLDRYLGGLKPGQMCVIAARPSVGKSSLAMNIAEHVGVTDKKPVAVFSLEMSAKELVMRLLCSKAKVDSSKAAIGDLTEGDIQSLSTKAILQISHSPLAIIERAGVTINQIRAQARRIKATMPLRLIIVDYLQLIHGPKMKYDNRNAEITAVSTGVKEMAKELGVPVIALAQLNRDSEKGERKPRLSDLRDSGSIEQDADVVALLHKTNPPDRLGDAEKVALIIAKNRNGRVGEIDLLFYPEFTRFESAWLH